MSESEKKKFVFYDPSRKRWKRFKLVGSLLLALVLTLAGLTLATFLVVPKLSQISLTAPKLPQLNGVKTKVDNRYLRSKTRLIEENNLLKESQKIKTTGANTVKEVAEYGYFVNWDDTSFTSLKQNGQNLDILIPEWLHIDENGLVFEDNPARQKQVLAYTKQFLPNLKITPLINNFVSKTQVWDDKALNKAIGDKNKQNKLINYLSQYVKDNNFAGLSIDFENIPPEIHENYVIFLKYLHDELNNNGKTLSVSVPADNKDFDYKTIGGNVDVVILMAYDYHWPDSAPGAIAPVNWLTKVVESRTVEIPANKIVVALGNYGYDWAKDLPTSTVSFQEAIRIARDSEGTVELDPTSLNPFFEYYDDKKIVHKLWYLDAVSAFDQMKSTKDLGVSGYALWRLGSEDPSIWNFLKDPMVLDENTAKGLENVNYGYDVDYEGKGEILKVVGQPTQGKRNISFDTDTGLIYNEEYSKFPDSYVIQRSGGSDDKKLALTFDDGPDPLYTNKILDILKENGVKASFFVVGENADKYSDILTREYKEGNEIGNHTFTHPNIARLSDFLLRLELNTTNRLLESRVGIKTTLFRPPYAEDVEPETPSEVRPLLETGNLGYYTVGINIDPRDWKETDPQKIVDEAVLQANNRTGNIILLHDSGGNRDATIKALPEIISRLKSQGFSFVTISELMGVNRNQVMQPVPSSEANFSFIDSAGFYLGDTFRFLSYYFFYFGTILGVLRFGVIAILAIWQKYQSSKRKHHLEDKPLVSVIVPAFNEGKVIAKTIESLAGANYENVEIIVVNDGSVDDTLENAQKLEKIYKNLLVLDKPNTGKSDSTNLGLSRSKGEIVMVIDADTVLGSHTIGYMVSHFANPRVGAVAGNAKVGNRVNWITNMQAIEYITSQNLDRRAFEVMNCITVVPGAIGAWRRNLVEELGGFPDDTLAEDADLTYAILRKGYQVTYEEKAVAYTEAPEKLSSFLKQRFRWMFGNLQVAFKHKAALFNLNQFSLGFVAMPNVIVFQIIFPFISPIIDLFAMMTIITNLVNWFYHPLETSLLPTSNILVFYLVFLGVDFIASLTGLIIDRKEKIWNIFWLIPQRFFYRQVMYYVAIRSVLAAMRGQMVGWNKFERTGRVANNN